MRNTTAWSRSSLVLAAYGGLAAVAVTVAALRGDGNIYVSEANRAWWRSVLSPLIGLAFGLLVVLATRAATHRFDWVRRLHRDFRGLLGEVSERDIFIIALASSIGEELLFRGALMPVLGFWLSSGLFALLHIGPGVRFLPWTLSALIMGLAFATMARFMGDLGGPIVAHFTINFLNLGHIVRNDFPVD